MGGDGLTLEDVDSQWGNFGRSCLLRWWTPTFSRRRLELGERCYHGSAGTNESKELSLQESKENEEG